MPDFFASSDNPLTRDLRGPFANDNGPPPIGPGTLMLPPSHAAGAAAVLAIAAAVVPESSPSQKIGRSLDDYELLEKIGAGGMGAVYKASHKWLDRTVAVKMISGDAMRDPDSVARFLREAKMVGALDHPNIVRATDAGQAEGVHFLVTEFIDGQDLMKVVMTHGPLRVADACAAICQAAAGLQCAHERGLVHRDIKPSNLMLTRDGTVKLLDFGLARMTEGATMLTSTGQVMGTLDFMAPEQAGDIRHLDIRADIYSLGCTLYYLLAGRPPFGGVGFETPASKLKGHLACQPRPIEEIRRDVPPQVLSCLNKMLAKDRAERFRSPAQIAAALAGFAKKRQLAGLISAAPGEIRKLVAEDERNRPLLTLRGVATAFWVVLCCIGRVLHSSGNNQQSKRGGLGSAFVALVILACLVGFILAQGFSCIQIDPETNRQTETTYSLHNGWPTRTVRQIQ